MGTRSAWSEPACRSTTVMQDTLRRGVGTGSPISKTHSTLPSPCRMPTAASRGKPLLWRWRRRQVARALFDALGRSRFGLAFGFHLGQGLGGLAQLRQASEQGGAASHDRDGVDTELYPAGGRVTQRLESAAHEGVLDQRLLPDDLGDAERLVASVEVHDRRNALDTIAGRDGPRIGALRHRNEAAGSTKVDADAVQRT